MPTETVIAAVYKLLTHEVIFTLQLDGYQRTADSSKKEEFCQ